MLGAVACFASERYGHSLGFRPHKGQALTNHACETLVTRNSFAVVTFAPLKSLGEVYCVLVPLSGEIELVYAALRNHWVICPRQYVIARVRVTHYYSLGLTSP